MKTLILLMLFTAVVPSWGRTKLEVVTSYPQGIWSDSILSGLKAGLKGQDLEITVTYFHSEHWFHQSLPNQAAERERLLGVIKKEAADLLLFSDDEVLAFLGGEIKNFQKPIFLTGINSSYEFIREKTGLERADVSVVWEVYPCLQLFDLMKSLGQKMHRLGVLTNSAMSSTMIYDQCLKDLRPRKDIQLVFEQKSGFLTDWVGPQGVGGAPVDTVLILIPYDVRDATGSEIPLAILSKLLKKRTSATFVGILGVATKIGLHAAFTLVPEDLGLTSARQIKDYIRTKKLGESQPVIANHFELNEAAWKSAGRIVPISFAGKKVSSENLKFGR